MKLISVKQLKRLSAVMLETQPSKHGAEDYNVMDNRQYILDALYVIDGRHKPTHAMHSLYTGLWRKYVKP